MSAIEILSENKVVYFCGPFLGRGKPREKTLIYKGKTVPCPPRPKQCYQLLINEFGIYEPRLKNFS